MGVRPLDGLTETRADGEEMGVSARALRHSVVVKGSSTSSSGNTRRHGFLTRWPAPYTVEQDTCTVKMRGGLANMVCFVVMGLDTGRRACSTSGSSSRSGCPSEIAAETAASCFFSIVSARLR